MDDDFEKLLADFINYSFSDSPSVEEEGPEWLKFRNYTSKSDSIIASEIKNRLAGIFNQPCSRHKSPLSSHR